MPIFTSLFFIPHCSGAASHLHFKELKLPIYYNRLAGFLLYFPHVWEGKITMQGGINTCLECCHEPHCPL